MINAMAEIKDTPAFEIISKAVSLVKSDLNSTYSTKSSFKSEKTDFLLFASKWIVIFGK